MGRLKSKKKISHEELIQLCHDSVELFIDITNDGATKHFGSDFWIMKVSEEKMLKLERLWRKWNEIGLV